MTDPVREEMMVTIQIWDGDVFEKKHITWGAAEKDLCDRLLRVTRGHMDKGICIEAEDNRLAYSTDHALTHTLDSLPEKKMSVGVKRQGDSGTHQQ